MNVALVSPMKQKRFDESLSHYHRHDLWTDRVDAPPQKHCGMASFKDGPSGVFAHGSSRGLRGRAVHLGVAPAPNAKALLVTTCIQQGRFLSFNAVYDSG